jgi:DnaD/phage-associated family protein
MASKYWIKLYIEILDDPKMGRMPDRLWRRTTELFLLAGEYGADGMLPEIKDMAWRLRVNEDSLIDDLAFLVNYGIVHQEGNRFVISKFAERQKPVSDAERMKRLRDRRQKEQYYGDEVRDEVRYVNVTNRNVDTDTESDTDTELTTAGAAKNVFSVYEHEIGVLTPHIAERLKDSLELYSEDWLKDAIKLASASNVRKLSYVDSILRRWQTQGKDNGERRASKPADKISAKDEHNEQVLKEVVNEIANTRRKER